MKKIIIAIDGFSGTGKSSTAKSVAKELGYLYIDSGAMYRATTLFFIQRSIDLSSQSEVVLALKDLRLTFENGEICLDGKYVSNDIRTMKVNQLVSHVASLKTVRVEMVRQQQEMGKQKEVVMDGRDIGTVVFPTAELKIFMTANADIRAERRRKELESKGIYEEIELIKSNLIERDRMDSSRAESPLMQAKDALTIDSSNLTFEEQVSKIVRMAKTKINEN